MKLNLTVVNNYNSKTIELGRYVNFFFKFCEHIRRVRYDNNNQNINNVILCIYIIWIIL